MDLVESIDLPIPILLQFRINTVMGYHDYQSIWNPIEWIQLDAKMEPTKAIDKFAVEVIKNDRVVGHLPKGRTGRFAKTVVYFLRASSNNACTVTFTGRPLNAGDRLGMKVPCHLHLSG